MMLAAPAPALALLLRQSGLEVSGEQLAALRAVYETYLRRMARLIANRNAAYAEVGQVRWGVRAGIGVWGLGLGLLQRLPLSGGICGVAMLPGWLVLNRGLGALAWFCRASWAWMGRGGGVSVPRPGSVLSGPSPH